MTGLDLSVGEELSRAFEPCLMKSQFEVCMKISRHNHSKGSWKLLTSTLAFLLATITLAACSNSTASTNSSAPGQAQNADIHKIKHVVIIMQENRSFNSYFGTFPGADGIPMQNGVPTVCIPDPQTNQCVKPYHDPNDMNFGGPHGASNAAADIDGDAMDGFIQQELQGSTKACRNNFNPACSLKQKQPDVMGYHDAREIPNYWAYAEQFVLQDHMFEPNASWSLPEHLFMVSEWSAICTRPGDPMSCQNALQNPDSLGQRRQQGAEKRPDYAWTDLTYLLHKANVSWAYYVADGTQPDCEDDAMFCQPKPQHAGTPEIWNPLPYFDTVRQDGELGNI